MALYGQDEFLTGDPAQLVAWISSTPPHALQNLSSQLRERRDADLPISRTSVDSWIRDCTRWPPVTNPNPRPTPPGIPRPEQPGRGSDRYKPPQVGAKDHQTVRDRLQYQSRGLHLPYVRSASYGQRVQSNQWTRASLRAHDDPYKLTSGNGMTINQDGLWTILVKTDWSIGHAEVVAGAAQATRLMVNGEDCGLRDYLDDDAYTAQLPINTFTWTDEFRAGTTLNVDIRTEGLGANWTAVCNVYLRAYLVRCADDAEFDMIGFPLPTPPNPGPNPPFPFPNWPPLGGLCPEIDEGPALPLLPGTCGGASYDYTFTVNEAGQVGSYRCVNGELTTQWSAYGWDGGQYFGGGTGSSGATAGGPGPFSGSW